MAEHATNMSRASQTVPRGVRCLNCGYDLAGLEQSGVCPECATPIAESMTPRQLRRAPAPVRLRVARGALWLSIAALLAQWLALSFVGFLVLLLLLEATLHRYDPPYDLITFVFRVLFIAAAAAYAITLAIGCCLLSASPSESDAIIGGRQRALRASVCVFAVAIGAWFVISPALVGVRAIQLSLGVVFAGATVWFHYEFHAAMKRLSDWLPTLGGRERRALRRSLIQSGLFAALLGAWLILATEQFLEAGWFLVGIVHFWQAGLIAGLMKAAREELGFARNATSQTVGSDEPC